MALGVDSTFEGLGLLLECLVTFARNRAASGPVFSEFLSEGLAVKALVSDEMDAAEGFQTEACSGEVMAVAGMKSEVAKQAEFIHPSQPLGAHAAARETDGLLFTGETRPLKAMLMEFDVASIDIPLPALGLLAKPTHQGVPGSAEAPSPELRIDGAPKAVARWQFPPRRTGAQDVEECLQMQGHNFGPATSSPGPPSLHYRMNEEALSRRATSRLRVSLLNMAPS